MPTESTETSSQTSTSEATGAGLSSTPDLNVSLEGSSFCDEDKMKDYLENHIENWVSSLSRDDLMSIAMTLHYALVTVKILQT